MLKKISFIKKDGTVFEMTGFFRRSYSGNFLILQELEKIDDKKKSILKPFKDYFFPLDNLSIIKYENIDEKEF